MPKSSASDVPKWLSKATQLKEVVITKLAAMPVTERSVTSKPGEWSAANIVEHLILFEEVVPGLWRESLLAASSPSVTTRSALLSRVVSFGVSKTGLRVPTVPELEPKGALDLDALERRWLKVRSALVVSLPEDPNVSWVLHPVLGPLSSAQMGTILAAHLVHHIRHWPKPGK